MQHMIHRKRGFTVVEVLIASLIISATTFALISASQKGVALSYRALHSVQASFLAEEGAEAIKTIRDGGWSSISSIVVDTPYVLVFNTQTNTWSLSTTSSNPIDSLFTRVVILSDVYRNSSDDIAETGTLDTRTKKVTVRVTFPSSEGLVTKEIIFYISDIFT